MGEEVMEGGGSAQETLAAAGVGDDGGGVHGGVWPLTGGQAWGFGSVGEGCEALSESSENRFEGMLYLSN